MQLVENSNGGTEWVFKDSPPPECDDIFPSLTPLESGWRFGAGTIPDSPDIDPRLVGDEVAMQAREGVCYVTQLINTIDAIRKLQSLDKLPPGVIADFFYDATAGRRSEPSDFNQLSVLTGRFLSSDQSSDPQFVATMLELGVIIEGERMYGGNVLPHIVGRNLGDDMVDVFGQSLTQQEYSSVRNELALVEPKYANLTTPEGRSTATDKLITVLQDRLRRKNEVILEFRVSGVAEETESGSIKVNTVGHAVRLMGIVRNEDKGQWELIVAEGNGGVTNWSGTRDWWLADAGQLVRIPMTDRFWYQFTGMTFVRAPDHRDRMAATIKKAQESENPGASESIIGDILGELLGQNEDESTARSSVGINSRFSRGGRIGSQVKNGLPHLVNQKRSRH